MSYNNSTTLCCFKGVNHYLLLYYQRKSIINSTGISLIKIQGISLQNASNKYCISRHSHEILKKSSNSQTFVHDTNMLKLDSFEVCHSWISKYFLFVFVSFSSIIIPSDKFIQADINFENVNVKWFKRKNLSLMNVTTISSS